MRVVRALLIVVGLVLTVVGLGGAAYVGSDDVVGLGAQQVDARPGQPVVVSPEVTSYRDLDLVLEVTGPATVGTMHPVDAASLVDGVEHYEVTGVRRDRLLGTPRDGRRLSADDVPDDLWIKRTSADPEGTMELDLIGDPVQVVVVPTGSQVPALAFGARFAGLFWLLLGIGLAGLVLVAVALWRGRVARRRTTTGTRDTSAPTTGPAEARAARRVAIAGAPFLLLISGCGWVPQEVAAEQAPARLAVSEADAQALLDDYDRRNNRAIERAGRPAYDDEAWAGADTGALLEADRYSTAWDELTRDPGGEPLSHQALTVYPLRFTRYPLMAVLELETTEKDAGAQRPREKGDDDDGALGVFVRESAVDPWLQTAQVEVPGGAPEPAEPTVVEGLAPEVDGLGRLSRQVDAWLSKGTASGLEVERAVQRERDALARESADIVGRVQLDPFDWIRTPRSAYSVPVEGGHVVLLHRGVRRILTGSDGQALLWKKGYDELNGSLADDRIFTSLVTTTAIVVPDDGPPRVIGLDHHAVVS